MAPRARYDGPYLEVRVVDSETNQEIDVVKRGGLLTADAPAKIRDELLGREDWSQVKDPAGSAAASTTQKED
jgi:hypothetical protein